VKLVYRSFCWALGVMLWLGGVTPPTARAQDAAAFAADPSGLDAPNIAGSDNMPWNRGISQQTRSDARAIFLEGNKLFKVPLFSQAVEKYMAAIEKWKHPAFYFNLAIAEINLSQYLEAREHLELAMQYGPDPLRADRFTEAKKQMIEVEKHLGRLRVRSPTRDAEITVDGVTLYNGPGDRTIWVTPRAHELTGKKPDYATQAKRVNVAAGSLETVDLSLRKLVEDRPWALWKPWAVIIGGVAIAGASGGLHAFSARGFSNYDAGFVKLGCATMGCTQAQIDMGNPKLTPELNHARLEQRLAVGGYIGAGALIAGGIVLLYFDRPHVMEREDPNPNGVSVVPVVSSDMVGLSVSVTR
jgi:hypothetical protein